MKKYFFLDESPYYKEKFLIRLNHDEFLFPNGTKGSYGVFISRLLNLSYAEYLRFARDVLGAEIIGKNNKYPVAFFDRSDALNQFIKLINKRLEYILFAREHPYDLIKTEDGDIIKIPFEEN